MRLTRDATRHVFRANSGPPGHARRAALLAALLAAIFALDRATDIAPVQHLYYVPIVLAGLWFTPSASLSVAGSAVLLYHFANAHLRTLRYSEADFLQIARVPRRGARHREAHVGRAAPACLAMTDDLTGLHNLRSFEARLAAMVRAAARRGRAALAAGRSTSTVSNR